MTCIKSLQGEVDRLKQSEAHSSTKLQSLKDEISMIKNTKQAADTQDCKKHNEITTLKQSLGDKVHLPNNLSLCILYTLIAPP